MEKNNHISALWPTLIGEFYNPEHEKIKNDLLSVFLLCQMKQIRKKLKSWKILIFR